MKTNPTSTPGLLFDTNEESYTRDILDLTKRLNTDFLCSRSDDEHPQYRFDKISKEYASIVGYVCISNKAEAYDNSTDCQVSNIRVNEENRYYQVLDIDDGVRPLAHAIQEHMALLDSYVPSGPPIKNLSP